MSNKTFLVSVIILTATIVCVSVISSRGEPVVIATNLENMPLKIAGYSGTEDFFSEAVYKELNADTHVYRHYGSKKGEEINLYIGYYGTAKGGRTPHNPFGCLPGAGWGIVSAERIVLSPKGRYSGAVEVNYILSQKGPVYQSVLHWYQSDGNKILSSGFQQNLARLLGRLMRNRNDGAFVEVSMISGQEGIQQAKNAIKGFAEEVLRLLPRYWPLEE